MTKNKKQTYVYLFLLSVIILQYLFNLNLKADLKDSQKDVHLWHENFKIQLQTAIECILIKKEIKK